MQTKQHWTRLHGMKVAEHLMVLSVSRSSSSPLTLCFRLADEVLPKIEDTCHTEEHIQTFLDEVSTPEKLRVTSCGALPLKIVVVHDCGSEPRR